jgi:hemoglobin
MIDAERPPHMARTAHVWSSFMLRSGRYQGDPFAVPLRLPGIKSLMYGWLALLDEACGETLAFEVGDASRGRARRIARNLRVSVSGRLPC